MGLISTVGLFEPKLGVLLTPFWIITLPLPPSTLLRLELEPPVPNVLVSMTPPELSFPG